MSGYAVRVTEEPCSQCPWEGRCELRPGRLKELRAQVLRTQGVFICHKSQGGRGDRIVAGPGGSAAVCSGWLKLGDEPAELQIAFRLGYVVRVPEPPEEP